jgi:hypothetical protein
MRRAVLSFVFPVLLGTTVVAAFVPAALTVVAAGPVGEIQQLEDANEIRIMFSEPMVSLGRIPSNPSPPWVRITPAIRGAWRWSGTTILIFTPDPATPLPHATRYTVSIDANAESAAGERLGAPYTFSFTTPTVRLTSVRWIRRDDRFDRPLLLVLTFNQRVRPADVAAHLLASYAPHTPALPSLTGAERARMLAADPSGVTRFDAKVATARQTAARTDPVALRVATTWDRERYPPVPSLVVLETTSVPPPGAAIDLTLDAAMPSPEGRETPPEPQRSQVMTDPPFLVTGTHCRVECNPSAFNAVVFSGQVEAAAFARALAATDITDPAREAAVAKPAPAAAVTGRDVVSMFSVEDAGFDRQPPARTWALTLDAGLRASDGQALGYPWVGIVENWHERAFTSFGDGHGVWEVGGGRQLPFYARNFRTVTEYLVPLSPRELMPRMLELQKQSFAMLPPGPGTVRRLNVTPDEMQSHGLDLSRVVSPAGTGLAWVAMEPGEAIARSKPVLRTQSTIVQATNLGISVKDSPQSTLVFVTALDTGEPVAGARVAIVNTQNADVWRGTTGADGVALAPALPLRTPDRWWEFSFIVTAEKDGDVAYVGSNWNEGISPWEFGASYQLWEATDILRGSVFTDRGVYRPGEAVQVKSIVRLDTPTGIRLLPAGSTLDVRVRDGRGQEVDRRQVSVGRWSSGEWSWTVPESATLGSYQIEAMLPGASRADGNDAAPEVRDGAWLKRVGGSFTVAAYRRPDFRVDTTLDADPAVAGTTIHGTVDARYLFGSALASRPARWSVVRNPDYSVPPAILERFPRDRYAFGYFPSAVRRDERVAGEDARLDADGRLRVDLPVPAGTDITWRYTFEGDVEDVSRQRIANRSTVVIHPAPWHIGLRRPAYFADVSAGTGVDVIAADRSGQLVPGVRVTLTLIRVQWNSIRRAEGGGFYTWEAERLEIPAGEWTVTTGEAPVAVAIPLPEGGSYQLRATAERDGRRTRTDVSFYGLGRGYTAWQRFDHNRITLEPERETWKPGERARIMIQSPWERATALLTVEREGVRRYERFTLTSTQQTVEVPVTEADIPNVYVSVLLIRGRTSDDPGADGADPGKPAFRLGYTEIAVEDATRRLAVDVSADREEYRPTNRARVSVTVKDAAGRAAPSEVTLWAVDHGVLSLTGYQPPDVLRTVYRRKALQVMNADSRQRIISRRVLTPKGATDGGGGGSEGTVRRDFRPLAFWLGSVETDANGEAVREVTLPESLTTYRIMAVAGDAVSRFGFDDAEIRVTKPLTLLAALPRFLALGDRASLGALVTNTQRQGGDAVVTIESLDPTVLSIAGDGRTTVALGAGATQAVRVGAVARATGAARVRVSVALGSETDAFETTVPVVAPARPEVQAAFGDTDGRRTERLRVPAGILPAAGGLDVSLASTALVGLGEGVRYLVDYPYGGAEQKASSALALVLAADLGATFSMSRIAPADYRERAAGLLAELPRYQCADGGFGWPGCRRGQPYLTSYVLHVMAVAREFGFAPADVVVTRALSFLETEMARPEPRQVQWLPHWAAVTAYGVRTLVQYGRNQDSNITRLAQAVDRMPVFALSYLADAIALRRPGDPRYADVLRRLSNAARVEGDQAHVEELDDDLLEWLWNSNARSTALVLEGLVRRGDDALLVQRMVRWLLAARTNGRWRNTQENATALLALVRYYKAFEAEAPDMSATVTLGGRAVGTAAFRDRSTDARRVTLAMPDLAAAVPRGSEAELVVSRAGTGRLYYTTRLEFTPATPPPPVDQGLRVERQYERFVEGGDGPVATTFEAGDLIRVTLAVTLPVERRYLAVTDTLPAGVEAVDGWFRTTAADLAREASVQSADESWDERWRRGGFDHVEKYDDRVVLFATRLSQGRHVFSYLVRATTSGTFTAAGTWAEQIYAPEVSGRAAPATVVIR